MTAGHTPPNMPERLVTMPPPERLFLWAIRAWSAHHHDLSAIWWSLDCAFAQEGIHVALPSFHQMMSVLYSGLKQWPDIPCVGCPHLGREEISLLQALAYVQRDDLRRARNELVRWTLPSTAHDVCRHAAICAATASAAGLHFTACTPNHCATARGISAHPLP